MSLEVIGSVIKNTEIAPNIYDMLIKTDMADKCKPGQFANILCEGGSALLRRPISICNAGNGQVRMIFEKKGDGTKLLSEYKEGQSINMLIPLGHGFDLGDYKNPVIVGGGIGVPPLLYLAESVKNPSIFLGFRSKSNIILKDEFEKCGSTVISTDDGSFGHSGLITVPLKEHLEKNKCDVIMACGPTPMLKGIAALAKEFGIPCQVSMEQRMACGIGACLVCACKTKNKDGENFSHVCKDGPVFNAAEVFFE